MSIQKLVLSTVCVYQLLGLHHFLVKHTIYLSHGWARIGSKHKVEKTAVSQRNLAAAEILKASVELEESENHYSRF